MKHKTRFTLIIRMTVYTGLAALLSCHKEKIDPAEIDKIVPYAEVTEVSIMDSLVHADSLILTLYDHGAKTVDLNLRISNLSGNNSDTYISGNIKFNSYVGNSPIDTSYSFFYVAEYNYSPSRIEIRVPDYNPMFAFNINSPTILYDSSFRVTNIYGLISIGQGAYNLIGNPDSSAVVVFNH